MVQSSSTHCRGFCQCFAALGSPSAPGRVDTGDISQFPLRAYGNLPQQVCSPGQPVLFPQQVRMSHTSLLPKHIAAFIKAADFSYPAPCGHTSVGGCQRHGDTPEAFRELSGNAQRQSEVALSAISPGSTGSWSHLHCSSAACSAPRSSIAQRKHSLPAWGTQRTCSRNTVEGDLLEQ